MSLSAPYAPSLAVTLSALIVFPLQLSGGIEASIYLISIAECFSFRSVCYFYIILVLFSFYLAWRQSERTFYIAFLNDIQILEWQYYGSTNDGINVY